MASKDLTPRLKKAKMLVLEGLRGERLAQALGVSTRTAHADIMRLVSMGEIIEITDGKPHNPKVYADAKKRVGFEQIPSIDKDPVKKRVGVPSTPECATPPTSDKTVRFHCTGCFDCPVLTMGDHAGRISDGQGYTVGSWSPITVCSGSARQYGTVRLFPGEDMHFTLYHAKAGPKLTVTPCPRDVYYKTADRVGPQELTEQVYALLNLLMDYHGWDFGHPVFKGVNHYAMVSDDLTPLLRYADLKTDVDNGRVHVDTSLGKPEIEVYDDHPGAIEDVITLNEIPERFDSIQASLASVYQVLNAVQANMEKLASITAQLAATQANITQTLTKTLNESYQAPPYDGRGYF